MEVSQLNPIYLENDNNEWETDEHNSSIPQEYVKTPAKLKKWVNVALAFNQTLPTKGKKKNFICRVKLKRTGYKPAPICHYQSHLSQCGVVQR